MNKPPQNGPEAQRRAADECPDNIFAITGRGKNSSRYVHIAADQKWEPPRKPIPINAPPGSAQKTRELAMRAERGEELFCDDDPDEFDGACPDQWTWAKNGGSH